MAQSNTGSFNKSFVAASRSGANLQPAEFSAANLKIIKTDVAPTGEAIQLVRPVADANKTTEEIIGDLVSKYDYKKELVKANDTDLTAIEQAFGSNLATQLLTTYDGSAIVTDTQQDLIGEKYLAEQIKRVQDYQKKNSVIDRYSYLLYEGDKDYKSNAKDDLKVYANSSSVTNLQPLQQQEYLLSQSKLQPSSSTKLLKASSTNLQPSLSQVQQVQVQQTSRQASNSQLSSLQDQLRRLQEEKAALERQQQEVLRLEQEKRAREQERFLQEQRLQQERLMQERARQEMELQQQQEQLRRQMELLALQQRQQQQQQQLAAQQAAAAQAAAAQQAAAQQAAAQAAAARAAAEQQAAAQQAAAQQAAAAQAAAQQKSSSSSANLNANLKSVTIDAYNDPQFKALLDQISKPLNVPIENVEIQAQWPSNDAIAHLADPIVIPAPEPIVISAPDIIRMSDNYQNSNSQSQFKTEVTFYPKTIDQKFYSNFDASQLNVNRK